jgi:DNA uptake protein ComE-like DNA-binding protein
LIKVPGITTDLADRLLAYRKANRHLASRDQLRGILGLEEKAFENIRYYLGGRATKEQAEGSRETGSWY